MINTLLIDIDNTLLDFNKCAFSAMKSGFSEYGLDFADEMYNSFREVNDDLWIKIEKGKLTRERLHKIRWKLVFERLSIDADGVAFEKIFLKYLFDSHEPVDNATELITYLADKYVLCAASNGLHDQQLNRLDKAGMLNSFDYVFTSEKIGFAKPDKEFFDACFEQLQIKKEEAMIIGDSLTADISGGVSYGIKTLWYNHYHEQIPDNLSPDYVVNSLLEIKKIL